MFVLVAESTTPIGSPPPGPGLPGLPENKLAAVETAPNAIMEALANIARQNVTAAPINNGVPAPTSTYNAPPVQTSTPQLATPTPYAAPQQPVNLPGMPYPFPQAGQVQAQTPIPPVTASNQVPGFPGVAPGAPAVAAPSVDPNVQQQFLLIKLLADQGVPYDKIPSILASMQGSAIASPAPITTATPAAALPVGQPPYAGSWGQPGFRPDESRDHGFQQVRSPNRYRNRSRSRSPPRHWGARDSPRGRSERDYGSYGRNSPGLGHMEDRDYRARGADYRQRSPGRRGRSPSPQQDYPQPPAEKWVDYDRTIPQGHIKGKLPRYLSQPRMLI